MLLQMRPKGRRILGDYVVILAIMCINAYVLITGMFLGEIYGATTHQEVSLLTHLGLGVAFTVLVFGTLFIGLWRSDLRAGKDRGTG